MRVSSLPNLMIGCWLLAAAFLASCGGPGTTVPAPTGPPLQTKPPAAVELPDPTITSTTPAVSATETEESTEVFAPEGAGFARTYGGSDRDRGIHFIQTADGGYAVVGYSRSFGSQREDIYLLRLDPQGNLLWSTTYGGEKGDNGWALVETSEGGFVILGFTNSLGAGGMDLYLLHVDREGGLLWERTYGGPGDDYGWDMAAIPSGGYVLVGQTESYGQGAEDGYLVRVDEDGGEIWSRTFGGPSEDRLFSISAGEDGFVLAGTTRSFGAGARDAYIVHTDLSGELTAENYYGEAEDDVAHSVHRTSDGGAIVTGYTRSFDAQKYDIWLMRLDGNGLVSWQQVFGGPEDDRAIYGEQTVDGGLILTGFTRSYSAGGWDVLLVKTDAAGEMTWTKTFGGSADDSGYTVHQTRDSGFFLTGETYSFGEGNGDLYVIRVDENGEGAGE